MLIQMCALWSPKYGNLHFKWSSKVVFLKMSIVQLAPSAGHNFTVETVFTLTLTLHCCCHNTTSLTSRKVKPRDCWESRLMLKIQKDSK